MNNRLQEIHNLALEEISKVSSMEELQNIRNTYLSKKSELMQSMSKMKDLQGEERAKFGQLINSIKMDITEKVEEKRKDLDKAPEGIINFAHSGNRVQYYYKNNSKDNKRRYIKKKDVTTEIECIKEINNIAIIKYTPTKDDKKIEIITSAKLLAPRDEEVC